MVVLVFKVKHCQSEKLYEVWCSSSQKSKNICKVFVVENVTLLIKNSSNHVSQIFWYSYDQLHVKPASNQATTYVRTSRPVGNEGISNMYSIQFIFANADL